MGIWKVRALTIMALALLGAMSGCAADASGASSAISSGQAPRPTIGPNNPPGPRAHEVSRITTIAGSGVGPATATCPQGEIALGGGWKLPSPASGGSIQSASATGAPVSLEGARVFKAVLTDDTWSVYVSHPPLRVSQTLPVTAYVECLAGASGAVVTQRAQTQDAGPERIVAVAAHCAPAASGAPAEIAVGFGFDFSASPTTLEFMGDTPASALGIEYSWSIQVANHESGAQPVSAFVECLSNLNASARYMTTRGPSVPGGAAVDVQQACPSETVVIGGGVMYHYAILGGGDIYRQHASANGWQGSLYASTGSSPLDITGVYVACLKFS
jgi:hypothetical protein